MMTPGRRKAGTTLVALGACLAVLPSVSLAQSRPPSLRLNLSDAQGISIDRPGPSLMLPNGSLIIADLASLKLFVISDQGRLVRTLGGRGRAPGEFLAISHAFSLGDSVLVVGDINEQRQTSLRLSDGSVLSTRALRETGASAPAAGPMAVLPTARDDVRFLLPTFSGTIGTPVDSLYISGPGGRRRGVIAFDWRRNVLLLDGGRIMSAYQPLDDSPLIAFTGDGESVVSCDRAAKGGNATGLPLTVIRHGLRERTSFSRFVTPRARLSRTAVDSIVDTYARTLVPQDFPDFAAARAEVRKQLCVTDAWPAATHLVVNRNASTALIGLRTQGATRRWIQLSLKSSGVRDFVLPAGDRVIAFSDSTLWSTMADDDGVVRLRAWTVK